MEQLSLYEQGRIDFKACIFFDLEKPLEWKHGWIDAEEEFSDRVDEFLNQQELFDECH
jgi:hypothetical protein